MGFLVRGLKLSCSGIGEFCGKFRDWWVYFHPPFPASGPWVRVGSSSLQQASLSEVPSLWGFGGNGEAVEEKLPLCTAPMGQLLQRHFLKAGG